LRREFSCACFEDIVAPKLPLGHRMETVEVNADLQLPACHQPVLLASQQD